MKKCDSSDNFSNSFDYIIYLNDTNKNDESITEIESNSSDNKSEDENIEDENDYMIYDELSENESIKTIPIPIKKIENNQENKYILDTKYLTPSPYSLPLSLSLLSNDSAHENKLNQNLETVITKK
jgi:hypothetical protein